MAHDLARAAAAPITAALFACDWNAVRSPMAEGIAKSLLGTRVFLQSAGAAGQRPLDGFAVAACREIGVDIAGHRHHTFDEMAAWGEDVGQYDLIVALSPGAADRARAATSASAVVVEHWPTDDPTEIGGSRDRRLDAYRAVRDALRARIIRRFGD